MEFRKQCQTDTLNSFTALWNLNDVEDMTRAWQSVRENIRITTYQSLVLHEQKQHKPLFEEQISQFLDQRKQAKMLWLQSTAAGRIW